MNRWDSLTDKILRMIPLVSGLAFAGSGTDLAAQPKNDPDGLRRFGIYQSTAPRAEKTEAVRTNLPLSLNRGDRIALIGNTLFERSQHFGNFEAFLHAHFPDQRLVVRHLGWSADAIGQQPRPANFADTLQHLTHERADVILAAFGFNESFGGSEGLPEFRRRLAEYLVDLRRAFNGTNAPRIVLVSPIANENLSTILAADLNNERIGLYADAMRTVAEEQGVAFVDVFEPTREVMSSLGTDLTINGIHLNDGGDREFSRILFERLFEEPAPPFKPDLRDAVVERNRQYFRRFRPVNTFYYTGGRNKSYGYLDFLPAMRNFDLMVENRDRAIWDLASGRVDSLKIDDSNIPPLPATPQSRGANRWMSAAEERKAFKVDPRFEVNLFAGEEQFPDIVNPIQMRWDAKGRLWVSCSTTYPHVYPGNEPNDKLVILEDTDGDGRADRSRVFAEDLHIPLSFEFGDGGVYVSEQPHLTFLKDLDGDDRADVHRIVLSGFGTEDSHHSLHDFVWTPGGDLIFRESIFHHSQVETPYGPVRQQNSGWFRFRPRTHRLTSFGTYRSTNPWGVTFDDWGQHVASHPVYAAAFHSLDPPYPQQHPAPKGLQAYSGVCGHEFVDFDCYPSELQGGFIKVRYKPTNRVEIHEWKESAFGFEEKYVGDLLFSTNLSFIPVDLRFGPRGALYVCDWYNPIKGHAQYSLRDDRRDRHSGRIWRITPKDRPLQEPPRIAGASIKELLDLLKRREYRYRYWAKRELRGRDPAKVTGALKVWVSDLDPMDPRVLHHRMEAAWLYRGIGSMDAGLLRGLLSSDDHHARAAATRLLRYWHAGMPDAEKLLRNSANDESGIVRMEAAIAASHLGTQDAFACLLDTLDHPRGGHLEYAIVCALGSRTMRPYWENDPRNTVAEILRKSNRQDQIREPNPSAAQAQFDNRSDLRKIEISCVPERMLFTRTEFTARPGQPVKLIFRNPDATDHNLVIVKPDALADVGMAANEMARDPRNSTSDFIPRGKQNEILWNTPMIGPNRNSRISVLRFEAPSQPGIYPYVCTFPGHWIIMNGMMVVASDEESAKEMIAANRPQIVREWKLTDFNDLESVSRKVTPEATVRGMTAFVKARCNQCHVIAGHGVNLGPDLVESVKKLKGRELLKQILDPSSQIHEKHRNQQFVLKSGRIITGVVREQNEKEIRVAANLLTPELLTTIPRRQVEEQVVSRISPMPTGLVNVLSRDEILDLLVFVESGGYQLPEHLRKQHGGHSH